MKSTIRIKLSKDYENILFLLGKFEYENKKNVLDMCISEKNINSLRNRINSAKSIVLNKIQNIKNKISLEECDYKSYAISADTKKILKKTSQETKINMTILVSLIIDDVMNLMMKISIDKKKETQKILQHLSIIKKRIEPDIHQMEKLISELALIYTNDDEEYPFKKELDLFLHGYHQFTP